VSTPFPLRTRGAAIAGLLGLGLTAGCNAALPGVHAGGQASPASIPVPTVSTVGQVGGTVPWDRPLAVAIVDGTLKAVIATDPDGAPVTGSVDAAGWSSAGTLLPSSTYRLTATVLDLAGRSKQVALTTRTSAPAQVLSGVLSPGDGKVVGVGQTVVLTLNHPVLGHADRMALVSRLRVTAVPAVTGAWRWMSATELHYRGPTYWAAHSTITAHYDFSRLHLSTGAWGTTGSHSTSYSVGSAVISTVDVTKHVMTVVKDGRLLRTVKVSTGRDKYPTKGGVHLVLEKTKLKVMDSATVGIPRNSPDGYFEKVPDSVRISYGGAFVHSADWSVRDQGVRNVSHGCVNISPTDAAWFFDLVTKGDVVNIIHASVGPRLSDPGMSDWNVPFADWANS
jgi:lipoprotein-anchoring transpeptidase ErfK/SrfK